MKGELLRNYLRSTGKQMGDIADLLGMTRQNLNHHLRKDEVEESLLLLIKSKLKIDFPKENMVEEGTPVYEISASASQMEHINQMPEVPAFTVKIPGYEDCNFGMYVYGHSMYPTIENGSLILCRKVNDKTVIMYGEIYLIRTADYLMVKRIQKNCKASVLLLLQHRPPLWRCQRLNLE